MPAPTGSIEANKAIVTQFFEGWEEGRFDDVEKLFDPTAPWWTLSSRQTHTAEFRLKRFANTYREANGSFTFNVRTLTAEEDRVAAVIEGHADFPDRGAYDQLYHWLFQVVDGKIANVEVYYDTALSNQVLRGEGGLGPLKSHA